MTVEAPSRKRDFPPTGSKRVTSSQLEALAARVRTGGESVVTLTTPRWPPASG